MHRVTSPDGRTARPEELELSRFKAGSAGIAKRALQREPLNPQRRYIARDSWKLVDETTGEPLMNPVILTPGFKTADAMRYLAKIKRQRDRQGGTRT